MSKVRASIRLEEDLVLRLSQISDDAGISMNDLAEEAIRAFVESKAQNGGLLDLNGAVNPTHVGDLRPSGPMVDEIAVNNERSGIDQDE